MGGGRWRVEGGGQWKRKICTHNVKDVRECEINLWIFVIYILLVFDWIFFIPNLPPGFIDKNLKFH